MYEEGFGLNSMHMIQIKGDFTEIKTRSESAYEAVRTKGGHVFDVELKKAEAALEKINNKKCKRR